MEKFQAKLQRFKERLLRKPRYQADNSSCLFKTEKLWLDLQYHYNGQIKKPDELENEMKDPPGTINEKILDKINGSLIGLALGDALGAHVEFRPYQYLHDNPVKDLEEGGTWGLKQGQFTDDTSMALCLAISLVTRQGFVPYDQLVRYNWWFKYGYMSSTGQCFDIGAATKQSLTVFSRRQIVFAKKYRIPLKKLDYLLDNHLLEKFKVQCSMAGVAGNGALMRLAPVPLFFYKYINEAIEFSGYSGLITHGDDKAYDACRYYGALICAALNGATKDELLDTNFYEKHKSYFGKKPLCRDVQIIAKGSYQKKRGYDDGIRGKGYIINALEAALWAFWSDDNSFEKGVLAAINLGDDTDTTAAIYGQLAGAFYGYEKLPKKWVDRIYAKKFILNLSKWIAYEGENWKPTQATYPSHLTSDCINTSASVENLVWNEPTVLYPPSGPPTHPGTVPLSRKYDHKGFVSPDIDSPLPLSSSPYSVSRDSPISYHPLLSQRKFHDTITSKEQQSSTHLLPPKGPHKTKKRRNSFENKTNKSNETTFI